VHGDRGALRDEDGSAPGDDPWVEVLWASNTREAALIADAMRGAGLDAVATVAPLADATASGGRATPGPPRVLVRRSQLDVALQALDLTTHRPEGDADNDEIERAFEDQPVRPGPPPKDLEEPQPHVRRRFAMLQLLIALAMLAFVVVSALRLASGR
jgi:hypothetical protein